MATLSPPESRRLYSWWWDSHNSPKNSKWLQDNLTDMDAKVKSMIKLIEEDADSFARRAEMYYKKRPELMKLVEEFYRAYRALAERYNHATGELRHAHHTIEKAFSDQVPIELVEDSPSKPFTQNRDLHTPETKFPVRRALFETYDLLEDTPHKESKCCLKKEKEKIVKESEVEDLKKSLSDVQGEKENVLLKYQHCLAKLSDVEGELDCAQKDSMKFNEKASRAEIEVQMLKEALVQLEAEKKAVIVKQKEYMEKTSHLKTMVSQIQEENKGLNERAIEAESEVSRLELEKEVIRQQYKQCLETISALENLISVIENEGSLLKKQAERAENEVSELKRVLSDLNKEKETFAVQYKCCLEMITKLERDIASAREEIERLNDDVLIGDRKISTAEEKCTVLETLNLSLKNEAANLLKKIGVRERELKEMEDELEKVRTSFHDEQLRHAKTEATLQSLQNLHSRSQDDQRALAIELKNVIRTLNDLEVSKCCLEEEIQEVREENKSLRETNLTSSSSMENMQNEISTLMEINERLEREVKYQIEQSRFLQKEIMSLKGEIEGLKSLQDENVKLRERNEEGSCEREIMSKKLENMQQLLNKKMVLEESSQFLCGEKAVIVSEKVSLLSQLETVTDNMHNLLEKNAVLESTLTAAKVEVEVLREKSNRLEEICELLKKETSYLLTEKSALELKSENVERKLESLEKRYMRLKEKCTGLEKEKEATHCQVEVLKFSLSMEKQERLNLEMQNETRLDGLENQIRFLKEENNWKKKEYEEELERSLKAQFEISILHKFIRDMEEKNRSLVIECQKHVDASKLAEKLISELESESAEQQVGADALLDEVESLRLGIYEVFKAVEAGFKCNPEGKFENEQTFLNHIVGVIEDMKCSLMKHEDEKERILVDNLVLVTLLEQLKADGMEIESWKMHLKKELNDTCEKLSMAKNEKEKLVELYGKLELDVSESCEHAAILEAELKSVCIEQTDLQKSYGALEEAYVEVIRDNEDLLKKFSVLEEEKDQMTQLNDSALFECIATDSLSVILRSFCEEKFEGLMLLIKDLTRQQEINRGLESEMCVLQEKVELQNAENLVLKDDVCKLEGEMKGMRESNVHMGREILRGKDSLLRTEEKLEAAENSNLELCRAVDELNMDVQELKQSKVNLENDILEFSEINSIQNKEIESLHIIKRHFEAEIGDIHEEMEERMLREQVSSIREVFFEKRVEELTVVCQTLENENTLKNSEIERMKQEICSMGNEISGLKSQIYAYNPIIEALRDDIMFLEQNVLLQTKIRASENQESEFLEVSADRSTSSSGMLMEEEEEDQSLVSLQNLQMRIKAVGKLMEEMKKPVFQRKLSWKSKQELPTREIEHPTSQRCLGGEHSRKKVHGNEVSETPKLQRIKTKASESRNGVLMKDIPLDRASNGSLKKVIRRRSSGGGEDQMLELWETVEDGNRDLTVGESFKMTDKDIVYDGFECDNVKSFSSPPSTDSNMEKELSVDKWEVSSISTEHNREANSRRVLERLVSDAQKLENLRVTVHNLRSELETSKKGRKGKNIDYETVQEQLVEAEETVANLLVLNGRLVKNIEEWPSPPMKTRRRRVREEARKGSERIGRLQLEIQKIQYMLMKMEEEKKNRIRNKFLKSKSVILREFVYNGRKNSARRKKGTICGCFRPSTSRSGRST